MGATLTEEHLIAIALACKENYMFDFDRHFPELVGSSRFSILSAEQIAAEVEKIRHAVWSLLPMQVNHSKLSDDQKKVAIGFYDNFHNSFAQLFKVIDKIWPSSQMTMLMPPSSEESIRRTIDNCRKSMDKLEEMLKKRDDVKAKKQAQRERAAAKRASVKAQPY